MQDPQPENITGEKSVQHVVKHEINWSHLVLAIAAIFIATKLASAFTDESDSDQEASDRATDSADISVEAVENVGDSLIG